MTRSVCIVGGGPAGLAAALAFRRKGAQVNVFDRCLPPMDKACGEGLLPDSIAALRTLGVDLPPAVGFPFRGIRFTDGRHTVSADFPNGLARGLRRPALHQLLIQHATAQGVTLTWGVKRVRLTEGGVRVGEQLVAADLVIGADGQNSQVRAHARLDQVKHLQRRYGFRRRYRAAPWSQYVELYWGRHSQFYVTPVAEDEVCVTLISRDPHLRFEAALCDFPQIAARLGNAVQVSRDMGAVSASRILKRVQRGSVALVGDASGSVDAITGEGICLAFKQALALAEAAHSGAIESYNRRHHALMQRPRMMGSLMLLLERSEQVQRRSLAGLAQHPDLFASLLAVHVGARSFRDLLSPRWLDFGRAFLAA